MDEKEKIINRLSLKYNLPKNIIEDIVESQFEFTRQEVKKIDFSKIESEKDLDGMKTSFRFLNIGSLAVSFKALKDIKKNKNKKK